MTLNLTLRSRMQRTVQNRVLCCSSPGFLPRLSPDCLQSLSVRLMGLRWKFEMMSPTNWRAALLVGYIYTFSRNRLLLFPFEKDTNFWRDSLFKLNRCKPLESVDRWSLIDGGWIGVLTRLGFVIWNGNEITFDFFVSYFFFFVADNAAAESFADHSSEADASTRTDFHSTKLGHASDEQRSQLEWQHHVWYYLFSFRLWGPFSGGWYICFWQLATFDWVRQFLDVLYDPRDISESTILAHGKFHLFG